MRIDQIGNRRLDVGLAQRLDCETAFPCAVSAGLPMLHGAAAADAEMRTDRGDALQARRFDAEQMPAVGVTRHALDFDRLARQRPGDEDRAVGAIGYAVAAMADPVDHKMLNHARPQ